MTDLPLRFATFLAPNMYPVYSYIARHIGESLSMATELVVGTSFDQFVSGDVDIGFICGLPYVELTRLADPPVEPVAAPVLQGERYAGQPIYFSDVIVRRESRFRDFTDLRGCSWAYNEPASHSGYNITRYTLLKMGETGGFFGRVLEAGFHQEAIRLVAGGTVDASAIDSQVLAVELRDHPELAERLRVIDALGPATIQPVVAASRLDPGLIQKLRELLLDMHRQPEARRRLDHGFVDRFVAVDDAAYDDIRAMVAAAEAADYLVLK